METVEAPADIWGKTLRGVLAYQRMMGKVDVGRVVSMRGVKIPPAPSRRNVVRHPLVSRLRSKMVPWVFGSVDLELESLVGVSAEEFRKRIAARFTEGMSWANHGYWHLDHVDPVSSFDHDDVEQVKRCWVWTNFQPLWGRHNLKKGKKLNYGKEI